MRLATALVLLSATAGPSAAADDLYTKYFAGVAGGKPCYARSYDDAHLKSHPRQTVRRIEVDFDQGQRDDGGKNTAANFQGGIGVMLKRSSDWYTQEIHCKTGATRFDCYLEGDGGLIRLIPSGTGLRLEVESGGGGTDHLVIEGAKDFAEFGGPGSDDRVFLLPRADRKLCDASTAN